MDILINLIYILVYPGFLTCVMAGLLLAGIDRKIVARMQKRIGPPILQPTYDFFKLIGKETIIPHHASKTMFLLAPIMGLISLIAIALFLPQAGMVAYSNVADVIVIVYLLTIPAVAIIMGGAASGSPFAGVGISREMVAMLSYELPLIIILLTVGKKVGMVMNGGITFSLQDIELYQKQYGMLLLDWSMIPAILAMLLVIPCEVGSHPFDIAEAETEICEGPLVEYTGAPLGIFKLGFAIKIWIMTTFFTALFVGGVSTGILMLDILIQFIICAVVMIVCMSFLKAITARLKVEQVFKFYWIVVTGLALISLILVWIGL